MENKINMVDLKSQYLKIKNEIDYSIHEIIDSTAFINGAKVKEFAANLENYLNVKHVIPCGNGTDALQIAMMALDLKPGDEVITPNFTFIATVEVMKVLGLVPVLVDVEPDTFNINPESVEKAITKKTKAIVPVHLFGQCADMDKIMDIAEKNNLFVIEDTAQAIGANYNKGELNKMAGCIGNIGCTSFFPSKNLGCYGDGGAIYTNDDVLAEKLSMIVNHGSKVKYYHDSIGVNSRLDTIQAAILDVKLKYLDDYNNARRSAADYYDKNFNDIEEVSVPKRNADSTHTFHQYTLQINNEVNRDALKKYLNDKEIPAMIYYPIPMHLQKAYKDSRYKDGDFPVTEKLCKTVLSLPMHTELNKNQQDIIINAIKDFF
ncbi:MAG: DegT/DnrJ/EryC1/StrS family aminotransferase [Bacteroidales bacterium]|jgi:UDP-2-acetamido-2-deoxy-ribo-hexuluronate aminotransferase|nr:DegT/DnrJ/EryC1/StrS family aminotransferase [Bacteroidales bacterium]